jgi:hypothetical protein
MRLFVYDFIDQVEDDSVTCAAGRCVGEQDRGIESGSNKFRGISSFGFRSSREKKPAVGGLFYL